MNISKLGALWSLATGGWAGLAEYILRAINGWLAKLDKSKLAEAAKIVKAVASALGILLTTFLPDRYKAAATQTLCALETLAEAMADGNITPEELDANIDAIEAAIEAWKEARK